MVNKSYVVDPRLKPKSMVFCQNVYKYCIIVNSETQKGKTTTIIRSQIWIGENEHYKAILK